MSHSPTQSFGISKWSLPWSREAAPIAALVRRWRLALGIGLVTLLVVLAALGEWSAPEPSTDNSVSRSAIEPGSEFDGRGKWGGYAR